MRIAKLSGAKIIGTEKVSKDTDMSTRGGVATGRLPGGAKEVTVYRNALRSDANIRTGLVHEGFHMLPQERNVVQWGGAAGSFQEDHQEPYNNKADELLRGARK